MTKRRKIKFGKPAIMGGVPTRSKPFASHPVMGPEEKRNIANVMKAGDMSGYIAAPGKSFNGGVMTNELESLFCKSFECKYAVAMNSATSALHAALLAIGIEPGDEVLVPPYTMSASASAILMCGGIPVFVDIDPDYYCMDAEKIKEKITSSTKAILVVHLFGQAADMVKIKRIAKEFNLGIVEDCAQAPGATYKNKNLGTFGDVGVFSLNQHKTITSGEGGVAVTNKTNLALKMQLVRNHGEVVLDHMPEAKEMNCLGWNYRFSELHAAIAVGQFKKLNKLTEHRIKLAQYLSQELKYIKGIDVPKTRPGSSHVYFVYAMQYNPKIIGLSRELFVNAVNAEGIPMGKGYVRPIYREPLFQRRKIYDKSRFPFSLQKSKNRNNYKNKSCPVTEWCHEKSLILTPICRYPLTKKDMDDVVTSIKKVIHHSKEIAYECH